MEIGLRVVRGSDWIWGEQDGGEGSVGTVVHLGGDGNLPEGTVLVCWDTGKQANYRAGYSGKYDLRVYDSAQTGVKHLRFTCDGCGQDPIVGTRWKCADCFNYDLCSTCYMNDLHDRNHSFCRHDFSQREGIPVGKRSNSTKRQAKGLFPGAKVRRGRDWQWGNQDGGTGTTGTLNEITPWQAVARSGARVTWNLLRSNTYRVGHEGKVDLFCVTPATGPSYYRDSLAKLGDTQQPNEAVKVGDRVTVSLDVEVLRAMSEGHGGWHDAMAQCIGCVGRVETIGDNGDIHVRYGPMKWVFHPGAVTKVVDSSDFRSGNRVKVMQDKEVVKRLQQGHGGWNDSMTAALGKEGRVLEVDSDGDVVVMVGVQVWLFNPAALQLLPSDEGGDRSPVKELDDMVKLLLLGAWSRSVNVGDRIVSAASSGDYQRVCRLLDEHPDQIDRKRGGKTALHVACHQGRTDIVNYLLSKNANVNLKDDQDYTALHHAAYGDRSGETVARILQTGTDVNVSSNKNKSTPLHLAVNQGNEAGVMTLLTSPQCDLSCQDVAGDTPLHDAISKDNHSIFDVLISFTSDQCVTVCNGKGFNPLHLACMKGNEHAVKKIADKYPGLIEVPKEDGFTSLHLAAFNNHKEIVRTLLLSGHCDVNMRTKKGQTALALAVSEAYTGTIEVLVEHGADVNAEDEDGDTPLHVAVISQAIGNTGLRQLFQELGVNLPGRDSQQNTGLAIACFLAVHGADMNYMNHNGKTPLDLCPNVQTATSIQQFSRNTPRRRPTTPQPRHQAAVSTLRSRLPTYPPVATIAARGTSTTLPTRAPTAETSHVQSKSRDLVNRAETAAPDCIICCENTAVVTFHPCSHMILCAGCSIKIKRCLLCNAVIERKITPEGAAINVPTMMDVTDYDRRLRSLQDRLAAMKDASQCQICMDREKSVVFLCGHGACGVCSEKLRDCHICRKTIQNRIPLFN